MKLLSHLVFRCFLLPCHHFTCYRPPRQVGPPSVSSQGFAFYTHTHKKMMSRPKQQDSESQAITRFSARSRKMLVLNFKIEAVNTKLRKTHTQNTFFFLFYVCSNSCYSPPITFQIRINFQAIVCL